VRRELPSRRTLGAPFVRRGATHSPIILSYPGAVLFSLDGESIREIDCRDTEHYRVTRDFPNAPERYFKHLFGARDNDEVAS
jgi:predicted ATPase